METKKIGVVSGQTTYGDIGVDPAEVLKKKKRMGIL
jgi:hypothetical protein